MWRFWKERRFVKFVETIQPSSTDILLDIGGYPFNWYRRGGLVKRVDTLNLTLQPMDHIPDAAPEIHTLQGDARQLAMDDQSYDIVFSNSVIEHVGDFQDQIKFAREARRVGKRLWIQTPARSCPIEPHYLGPFIHWFPKSWHVPLARWASIRGLTKSASFEELSDIACNTRLLNKHEFESLFPDCDIVTEKLLFIFPKSYIAIRKN
jgi:SAM-dependent methyltransferase